MRGIDSPETRSRAGSIRAVAIIASVLLPLAQAGAQIPDTDGDGIVDNLDNCVTLTNAGQQDTDSDGIGNRCDADLNNDGFVNFGDLAAFKSVFFPNFDIHADFNSDGGVNFGDLAILKQLFNMPPGPAGYAQWITDADGDWGERLNWFPAVVPPAEAYVTIDVPSAITVTVDDNESFAATQVDSQERIVVDGTLAVAGTVFVNDDFVLANGGRLEDATLLPGGSALETLPSTSFTFDNITLADDFTMRNNSNLNLYTGLTLSGTTFEMASTGNNTSVIAQGSLTIGGTGTIEFAGSTGSDAVNRLYQQTAGETLTIGPGVAFETVTTGGRIGLNSGTRGMDVQGPVNSGLADRVVRLEGEPLNFRGDLLATSNGGAYYFDGDWINDETITLANSDLEFEGTWANTGQINVINTPIELDGLTTSTGLGVITSDGEVLLTGTVDNTSQTLDVDSLPAGFIFGNDGWIMGGTITGSAGLVTANSATVRMDGVTLATDFTLNNNATLNLYDGMMMSSSTFTFASTGNNTSLVARGGQMIGGTGTLLFGGTTGSDTTNRFYQQDAGATLTLGPDVTVQTDTRAGRIGLDSGGRGMEVLGTVISNVAGREVHLEGEPLSFDADNLLASGGGGFYISGDFTIESGDTLTVTGGEVDLKGDWINDGTIVVTDGDLNLEGIWDNNGTITANNSLGELDGELTTADLGTINSDGVVQLTAIVDNTSDTLNLDDLPAGLVFANSGRINGGIVAGSSALVTANSAAVHLDDVILQTDFILNNNTTVDLYTGLTLTGTTFTLASTGNNTTVRAQGGLTVDGTGTIEFAGSTGSDTVNRLYQQTAGQTLTFAPGIAFETVTTGGRIGLDSGTRGMDIQGPVNSDLIDRYVRLEGEPVNFRGDLLTASDGGGYFFDGIWTNDEIITLTNSDLEFEGTWSNSGQVNVLNTPLELDGTTTTAGLGVITSEGDVLLTGTVDNTGATLNVDLYPAGLIFTNGGRIDGGTISGAAGLETANSATVNLDGVTLATDFTLNNNATLNLYNGMTLSSSTFTFASTGNNTALIGQTASQTIGGTGTILFGGTTASDLTNRLYQQTGGQTLTLGPNVTVESDTSGGRIGLDSGSRGMTVLGNVISDVFGREMRIEGEPLAFDADNLLASGGGGFYISGDFTIQSGDTLSVDGGAVDLIGGTWENAGTVEVMNGGLNMDGDWTNTGTIDLMNAPLELDGEMATADIGTITSNSTITLTAMLDNSGSVLDLDALPAGFILGSGAVIDGGNIDGSSGLWVSNSSTVNLDGVTLTTDLTIANNALVDLSSGLTFSGGSIILTSTGNNTSLRALEGLTIGGTGEIVFAGSTFSDTTNRIYLNPNDSQALIIGEDVIVRTDTAGGRLGIAGNRELTIKGQVISDHTNRQIRLEGTPLNLEGAVSIAEQCAVEVFGSDLDMTPTGALDIDISSLTDFGYLDANQAVEFDGDLNLTLIGGYTPAECDEFVIGGYTSRTGTFDNVNGPDFGGQTFEVFYDATELRIRRPGGACP